MQGASRLSLAQARDRLERQLTGPVDLARCSDELFSVATLLDREFALRRVLSDPATSGAARIGLLDSVLAAQLSEATMTILRGVIASRWSRPADLTDGLEDLGRLVVFIAAERAGALDEVEDELFRFGRILDREPQLTAALEDRALPAERRVGLLDSLVGGKVRAETRQLLDHVVAQPRERSLDRIIDDLSNEAAEHRSRSIAKVRSSVQLTPDQESRLAAALRRIYGRDVVLHVEVDRDLVGGLIVQVNDDVIDGSIATRLEAAARGLTR